MKFFKRQVPAGVLWLAALAGCEGTAVVGSGADGGSDATMDAPLRCPSTQTACGEACFDLQSEARHCGACGSACARGATVTRLSEAPVSGVSAKEKPAAMLHAHTSGCAASS